MLNPLHFGIPLLGGWKKRAKHVKVGAKYLSRNTAILLCLVVANVAQGGILGKVRDEVRSETKAEKSEETDPKPEPKPKPKPKPSSERSRDRRSSRSHPSHSPAFWGSGFTTFGSTSSGPPRRSGFHESPTAACEVPRPDEAWEESEPSRMPPLKPEPLVTSEPTKYSRLILEGGSNFDELHRFGGSLRLEALWGLGIEGSVLKFYEELPSGDYDSLALGDFNLTYRIIDEPFLQARLGFGAAWLMDDIDTDFGLNLTSNATIHFTESLYLALEGEGGTLGDARLLHGRATVGCLWGPFDTFIGYDLYAIGSAHLQGMVFGTGFRF